MIILNVFNKKNLIQRILFQDRLRFCIIVFNIRKTFRGIGGFFVYMPSKVVYICLYILHVNIYIYIYISGFPPMSTLLIDAYTVRSDTSMR